MKTQTYHKPWNYCVPCLNIPFKSVDILITHIKQFHLSHLEPKIVCNYYGQSKGIPVPNMITHFKQHVQNKNLEKCSIRFIVCNNRKRRNLIKADKTFAKKKKQDMQAAAFFVIYDYDSEIDQCVTVEISDGPIRDFSFNCFICQNLYKELNELQEHIVMDHSPIFYLKCLHCDEDVSSLNEMKDHIYAKHPPGESIYRFKVVDPIIVKQEAAYVKDEPIESEEENMDFDLNPEAMVSIVQVKEEQEN